MTERERPTDTSFRRSKRMGYRPPPPPPDPNIVPQTYAYGMTLTINWPHLLFKTAFFVMGFILIAHFLGIKVALVGYPIGYLLSEILTRLYYKHRAANYEKPKRKRKNDEVKYKIGDDGELVEDVDDYTLAMRSLAEAKGILIDPGATYEDKLRVSELLAVAEAAKDHMAAHAENVWHRETALDELRNSLPDDPPGYTSGTR